MKMEQIELYLGVSNDKLEGSMSELCLKVGYDRMKRVAYS